MQALTVALLVGGLFIFLSIGMILNSKVPVPEGVESLSCGSCASTGCPSSPTKLESLKQEIKNSIKKDKDSERV